jgi:hypothetical protein
MANSFINEQIVYSYMQNKFDMKDLFLYPIIKDGKLLDINNRGEKVINYKQISGTRFPDIDEIQFYKQKNIRPAEVKFVTSKFNYHNEKKYAKDYKMFNKQHGVIICVKHDFLPKGMRLNDSIDVYQIDYIDFIQYCKENFALLISRQIDLHFHKNIWIMYASSNFYNEVGGIKPGLITKRWAPSQNLGNLAVGIGDIILFIKCKGINRIQSQKYFLANSRVPHPELFIENMVITKVNSDILSREEYCYKNKIDYNTPLWPDEVKKGAKWKRIFEFDIIKNIHKPIFLNQLYNSSEKGKCVATFLTEVFQKPELARKIKEEDYIKLLEYIV